MILVTGATGNIGKELVPQLLAKGEVLRVVTRDAAKVAALDPKVERTIGDLRDDATVKRAVAGVDAVFLVGIIADASQTADRALIAESARAGVHRIVKISSRSTGRGIGQVHFEQEELIRKSTVAWTFLRCGMFMSNTLGWASTIAAQGAVFSPFGQGKMGMIAPRDIAAVATLALTNSRHQGETYELYGAELLTAGEQVEILSRVLGRSIKLIDISPEAAGERLRAAGRPDMLVDGLVALWTMVRAGQVAFLNHEVARLTGRPAQSFEAFCEQHKAAFGASAPSQSQP
jgi:(4-alkanoyl-5-oxo-2,5-dihydrofuran-3-yl)methyl phosphate reductase